MAAERYCLRAQLPEFIGGPSGKSFFIDGGNGFDVYLFTSIAREHGLDLHDALDNIIISRAFTPYELVQLIAKDANRVIDRYRPKLLVISNVFDLFSRDKETDEARRLMGKIRNAIFRINRSRRVPIVITARNRVEGIEPIVQEACNVEVEFVEERHQIVSRLLRHPSKLRMQIAGYVGDELYNQESLSPEAMTRG
ncbi:MAG: hypothetical protein HYY68_04510 [Thaumarchaeota archaeon]|nr:hypothetical protein [Nitrososphaerota archaeon]